MMAYLILDQAFENEKRRAEELVIAKADQLVTFKGVNPKAESDLVYAIGRWRMILEIEKLARRVDDLYDRKKKDES